MKNKKIFKKVLALICSAALLVECFAGYATSSKAADTTTVPAELQDYTRITMENFGIEASTETAGTKHVAEKESSYTGETLNQTYLDVDVNFHGGTGGSYFQYLHKSDWKQYVRVIHYVDGLSTAFYQDNVVENSVWLTRNTDDSFINLKLAVDMVANANDNSLSDITLQVWIDNVLQGKLEFTANADELKNIYVVGSEDAPISFRTPVVETTEPEPGPEGTNDFTGYNRITMKNFGLDASTEESGTVYAQIDYTNGVSGTYTGNGLNKTYLDVDIKFNFVSTNYFHFFGSSDWSNNIRFEPVVLNDDTGIKVWDAGVGICSDIIEVPGIPEDTFFNLKIKTDIVSNTTDATKDDVTLQFYFNDTYAGKMTWTEEADTNHNNFFLWMGAAESSFSLRTPVDTAQQEKLNALDVQNILGENTSATFITSDLSLPGVVGNVSVTWTSSNTDVITNDGVVSRPVYGADMEAVTMTVMSEKASREIHLLVPPIGAEERTSLVVENADFEETGTDDVPGWAFVSGKLKPTGTMSVSDTEAYTGENSLKIVPLEGNQYTTVYSTGILGIRDGYTYSASVMAKSDELLPTLYLVFFDKYSNPCGSKEVYGNRNGNWHLLNVSAVAPSGAAFARIQIAGGGSDESGTQVMYADAVSLTELPLLKNSAFLYGESGWTKESDGSYLSDAVVVQDGLEYVLSGTPKGTGTLKLIFYDTNDTVLQECDGSSVVRAFAPQGATKLKVKISGKDDFSALSLQPSPTGTQVADGSFESMGAGTGSGWLISSDSTTVYSESFDGGESEIYVNDFEEGISDSEWGAYTTASNISCTTSGENNYLKLSETPTYNTGVGVRSQAFEVENGKTYAFAMDYKASRQVDIYIQSWTTKPSFTTAGDSNKKSLAAATDWKEFSTSITISNETVKYLTVMIYFGYRNDIDNDEACIDNVRLACVSAETTTDWSASHPANGGTVACSNEQARTGSQSLKLDFSTNISFAGARSPMIPVSAGSTYDVSAYYQTTVTNMALYVEFWPENPITDVSDMTKYNRIKDPLITVPLSKATTWTETGATVKVPENAVYASLLFYGPGVTYVDDVSIIQINQPTYEDYVSTELVTDGSFGVVLDKDSITSGIIPVLSGKDYTATVTAKSKVAEDAKLTLTYYDKENKVLETKTVTTSQANQNEVLCVNTTAPFNAVNAQITLSAQAGQAWFDGTDMYALTDTVANASFEYINTYTKTGNFPTQWRIHGNVVAIPVSIPNNILPDGSMALKVNGIHTGGVYSSMIRIDGGTAYTARIMASSENGGGLRLVFFDESFEMLGKSAEISFSGKQWTKYTSAGTAPANAAYVVLELTADEGEAFFVDSAEFSEAIVQIQGNTQMFIDDYLIASNDLTRTFHQGTKTEPVMQADSDEWQSDGAQLYGTVLYDEQEGIYKMWYMAFCAKTDLVDAANQMACYATSKDGVTWEKPNLGIFEYSGNKNNNIIGDYSMLNVFKDMEETDEAKRYKAVTYLHNGEYAWLYSSDGINWTKGGTILAKGDVINTSWDATNEQYYTVLKAVAQRRDQWTVTADTMDSWNIPIESYSLADVTDALDIYMAHSYGMSLYEKDGNYIGFNWMGYIPGSNGNEGVYAPNLAYSRDLTEEWQRPTRTPIIPLGEEGSVDDGMIFTASSALEVGDEVWVYTAGWDGDHGLVAAERDACIYITKWRMDGFASLDAKDGNTVETRPFVVAGDELHLNANADDGGKIQVELVDERGNPIDGFTKEDCDVINSDNVAHTVSWNGNSDLTDLEGEIIILRIYAENSEIYSFQFAQ